MRLSCSSIQLDYEGIIKCTNVEEGVTPNGGAVPQELPYSFTSIEDHRATLQLGDAVSAPLCTCLVGGACDKRMPSDGSVKQCIHRNPWFFVCLLFFFADIHVYVLFILCMLVLYSTEYIIALACGSHACYMQMCAGIGLF